MARERIGTTNFAVSAVRADGLGVQVHVFDVLDGAGSPAMRFSFALADEAEQARVALVAALAPCRAVLPEILLADMDVHFGSPPEQTGDYEALPST